jgi:hypothetical protein
MAQNENEGVHAILFRHAKNLLRITSIPPHREVDEFRRMIRTKLEIGTDIMQMLREIQEKAFLRAEAVAKRDHSLHEYYMAVYEETAFLLSALTKDRWTFSPHMAETA